MHGLEHRCERQPCLQRYRRIVSGASAALKLLEPSCQPDLNGDGAIASRLLGFQDLGQTAHTAFLFAQSPASAAGTDLSSPAEGGAKLAFQYLDSMMMPDSGLMHATFNQLDHSNSDAGGLDSTTSSDLALVQVDWRQFDHFMVH